MCELGIILSVWHGSLCALATAVVNLIAEDSMRATTEICSRHTLGHLIAVLRSDRGAYLRTIDVWQTLRQIDQFLLGHRIASGYFLVHFAPELKTYFLKSPDPARYASLGMAIKRVNDERVEGAFAEVGVYRGDTSKIIHALSPDRRFYLFDTFEGYPTEDLEGERNSRFEDTSIDTVVRRIGSTKNIIIRKGYFPATSIGLEKEIFSIVLLDLNLYAPTKAGLEFFYPRISPGGYLFVHDYHNPEFNSSVARAVDEFRALVPEGFIEIPDSYGTVVLRKARTSVNDSRVTT